MIIVSVVIPFYSTLTGLLKNAVQSALNQTEQDIEVIVVDDGSPLSAREELIALEDNRLRIIRHEKNSNGGIARNTGIDAAVGEFIAFLDYDDIWYSDKLEQQIKLFQQVQSETPNPVVYSRCKIIDGARTMVRPVRAIADHEPVGDYLFCARQIIQTSGIFLQTTVAKAVRFDDLKRHQDYQFCLALEQFGCKFFMLDKPSYEFIQIPKLNDYNFSLSWIQKYSSYLTHEAIKSFYGLVVVRSMINHGHFKRAISFSYQMKVFSYCIRTMVALFIKSILFRFLKKV